jgi:hypothetical protein
MIEFTGQEPMMWMFVGIFYGTINAPVEKDDLEFHEEEALDEELATEEPIETAEAEEPVVASKITR